MPYDITIQNERDYLRVEVSGKREPGSEAADAIDVWSRVADACRAKHKSKVLGFVDLGGRFPTMAAYKLAESPESFGWDRRFQLAVVDVNDKSREDNLFTETVAVNRGFNVRIFANEEEALAWLLEEDTTD